MDKKFQICVRIKYNQDSKLPCIIYPTFFFSLEDQGKEGNPKKKTNKKYEECPVEDYVFKLDIIQCLLESSNKTVVCEDSKLN